MYIHIIDKIISYKVCNHNYIPYPHERGPTTEYLIPSLVAASSSESLVKCYSSIVSLLILGLSLVSFLPPSCLSLEKFFRTHLSSDSTLVSKSNFNLILASCCKWKDYSDHKLFMREDLPPEAQTERLCMVTVTYGIILCCLLEGGKYCNTEHD